MSLDLWVEPVLALDGLQVLLTLLLGALAAFGWYNLADRWRKALAPWFLAAFCLGTIVVVGLARYPDWDETEHLHSTWLVAHGHMPYLDFWQHHSPLLWIVLSPLMRLLPPGAYILDLGRGLSLLLAAAAAGLVLWLSREVRGSRAALRWGIVLWLGALGPAELYNLRPDLAANVCSLSALALLCPSVALWRVVGSGVLLGTAVAFTPKHLPMLLVLPVTLLLERTRPGRLAAHSLAHWLGVVLGVAPLALWLSANDLTHEFIRWVFGFNSDPRLKLGGLLPLLPLLLVVSWLLRRQSERWVHIERRELLLIVSLVAGVVMMLVQPFHKFLYGLQMFWLLAAATGATEARRLMDVLWAQRRAHLAGLLLAMYFMPTALMGFKWFLKGEYFTGRAEVAGLIEVAANQPVFSVPPAHPIFAEDATDVNQPWQWHKWLYRTVIRERLKGLTDRLLRTRPVIVLAGDSTLSRREAQQLPVSRLVRLRVISEEDGDRLQEFLDEHYDLVRLGYHIYWLREDKHLPDRAVMLRPASTEGEAEEEEDRDE